MMNMVRLVASSAVLSVLVAFGADLPAPDANGVVTLASGESYTLTESSDLTGITQISVTQDATLTYDVASGETLTVPCMVKGKGKVVKNGEGTVHYTYVDATQVDKNTFYIELPGYTEINAGVFKLPNYKDKTNSYQWQDINIGRVVVHDPGTLHIAGYTRTMIYGLWGDGAVTCTYSTGTDMLGFGSEKATSGDYVAPSQFSGPMSGSIRVSACGYADVLSTGNANTGNLALQGGGSIGVMKIGNNGGNGSLGTTAYDVRGAQTTVRYLGDGETTSRPFSYGSQGESLTLDAGKGGLKITSDLTAGGAMTTASPSINLAGDGSVVNEWSGKISGENSVEGCALTLVKSGAGTWKLSNGQSTFRGPVRVENGTLAFTAIGALGTGVRCTDYGVSLGASESVGTLDYVGTAETVVSGRPIKLAGQGGRLNADSGIVDWTGVSAESATTLTLSGSHGQESVVRDVTGPVSVAKEGAGAWRLDAGSPLAGDLTVNGGTLTAVGDVSQKDFDFTWFKVIFRGVFYDHAHASGDNIEQDITLEELAFYDENGDRVMDGWTFKKTYETGSNDAAAFPDLSNIQPGEYGWLPNANYSTYKYFTNRDADMLFDGTQTRGHCCITYGARPLPSDPESWFTLLVRAPAGKKIAAIDLLPVSPASTAGGVNSNRVPSEWTVMGSEDGQTWYTLKTFNAAPGADTTGMPAGNHWYSDNSAASTASGIGRENRLGKGYAAKVEGSSSEVLKDLGKVAVKSGATLKTVGTVNFKNVELSGGTLSVGDTNTIAALTLKDGASAISVADGASLAVTASGDVWGANATLAVTTAGSGACAFSGVTAQQAARVTVNGTSLYALTAEKVVTLGGGTTCPELLQYLAAIRASARFVTFAYGGDLSSATAQGVLALNPKQVVAIYAGDRPVGLDALAAALQGAGVTVTEAKTTASTDAGRALQVWKALGNVDPYSDVTVTATGHAFTFNYLPTALPLPKNEAFDAAKADVADDYALANREILKIAGLSSGNYTLTAGGTGLGTYTGDQLAAGVNLAEAYASNEEVARAAYAQAGDAAAMIRAAVPVGLTVGVARQNGNALVIDEDLGDVYKTAEELAGYDTIVIGAGSRLRIKDQGSKAAPVVLSADIVGAGSLYVENSAITFSGDNRLWTGAKTCKETFVVVSSRYGLGSPSQVFECSVKDLSSGYLIFTGNGLTNDVPLKLAGSFSTASGHKTGLTVGEHDPLVLNGPVSLDCSSGFAFGDYLLTGGVYGYTNPWGSVVSGCEAWITGPFAVDEASANEKYFVTAGPGRIHIRPNAASTRWPKYLYPANGGHIICEDENIWDVQNGHLALGQHMNANGVQVLNPDSKGTFDLNGYDQAFGSIGGYNGLSVEREHTGLDLRITSATPATLTMNGNPRTRNGVVARSGVYFTGEASFAFLGTGAFTNVIYSSTSTGTLTVGDGTNRGEVFFDWGARWNGDIVLNGGRFGCDTNQGVYRKAKLAVSNGGKLIVPAGVTLKFAEVTVGGAKLSDGMHAGEDWIEGEGSVAVGKFCTLLIVR